MVQSPEVSSPTSEAQAWHPAGAPRPCQPHGSEEKGEKERKRERKKERKKQRKKQRKEENKVIKIENFLNIFKNKKVIQENKKERMKRATKQKNKSTNDNKC